MAVRILPSPPVRDTIRQVSESSWLVGDLLLQRFPGLSISATWNDPAANAHYTLTDAPSPPPASTVVPADSPVITKIYDAGDATAVFAIDHCVVLKIKCYTPNFTSEVTTLDFVRRQNRRFDVPNVIHYVDQWNNDRMIVFYQRLPGRTLNDAWHTLDDHWRSHYKMEISRVCQELAKLTGDKMAGVDGREIPEYFLANKGDVTPTPDRFAPDCLFKSCQDAGIDCSSLVFYHADLGPVNIIVEAEPNLGNVGIIDWEIAGFFPRGWVRTKFHLSSGMDFDNDAVEDRHCWRRDVGSLLGDLGFESYAEEWQSWRANSRQC
ncbi:hypothetical protein LOZ61_006770 [Ophidiomyces ophidiicola]|uniref:Uncharacterized protein n=1 Tax=Ophidiomyces ophidiicola TaxID=1387563 RepID=A0ACB8USF1_9EURO|nr:hypothetical protein LOZ61_006770 [Ophidiomyces ophidiicola]KAI1911501.1 hypothetical protein LOZ64_004695 [Ophidiomyces ophidiicola]KAI1920349.1 hypothetical protein LOZ60_006609 [Ophidiomyces ophidiicola]KAI1947305.1 hypothetical protein LOZ59_006632 [Ophidiomyces ophidiicola]KAI1963683.1 hypothetical protein LOZ56_006353 [Ophidiomyces ophidiicola]